MRFFQCAVAMAVLAVCSSQLLPGYFSRKQMSESALFKFLSAVRGGGRGHREFMALTSGSNPASVQSLPPPQSLFRLPHTHGVTHIPPPPKIGAFYITPPEKNAPYYYGAQGGPRRPKIVQIAEYNNNGAQGAPMNFLASESSQRPRPPPPMQFIQLTSASNNPAAVVPPSGIPNGAPIGPSGPSGPSEASSLQEIIANAAQKQHARVLEKEQKAHPNAQITNSQILVPGPTGGGVGQQPIFINQFGQPFLAPAIFSHGQRNQPQSLPPQLLTNGQGIAVLAPGAQPQFQRNPTQEQLLSAQNQAQQPQLQYQFLPGGFQIQQGQSVPILPPQGVPQRIPQGQRFPLPIQAQQLPGGGQLFNFPVGAPHVVPGQIAIIPQGAALKGLQGSFIPGNAILNQPHFAVVNPLQQIPQIKEQITRPQSDTLEKEEQPTRPLESASQVVSSSLSISPSGPSAPSPSGSGSQMTAAIMQSQMEFSEPIVKH